MRGLMWSERTQRGLSVGLMIAVLVLAMLSLGLFTSMRLTLNNLYFLPQATSDTVVIVAIDNPSLAAYGRSPVQWSRTVYADLITQLNADGARVVAFDVLFAEPTPEDAVLVEAIQAARFNPDGPRTRTVMPLDGTQLLLDISTERPALAYRQTLAPVPELAAVADQLGYINTVVDVDGAVRRAPSFMQASDGALHLGFSLATYLTYSGIPAAVAPTLLENEGAQLRITPDLTPDRVLYVDERGLWQHNYFGTSNDAFTVVSLRDVVQGDVVPGLFEDKIVLVGLLDATGLVDRYNAPLALQGQSLSGVEIHANAIETLIQQKPLRGVDPGAEVGLVIVLAVGAGLLYAHLRWYWMLATALGLILLYSVVAFVVFDTQQMILNLLYGWSALGLTALLMLGMNITLERSQRERAEILLHSVQAAARQRLSVQNMLPHLSEDIARIVPHSAGTIQLDGIEPHAYTWGTVPSAAPALMIPLVASGQTLGRVTVQTRARLLPRQRRLVAAIVQGAAPHLENAQLYEQAQHQNRLLEGILTGAPSGVLVLDTERCIRHMNDSVGYEFETSALPYIGQRIEHLLAALHVDDDQRARLITAFQTETVFREEIRQGARVYYLDAVLLADIARWVVIISNVTSLAQLNMLKTRLLRMLSHDLKNPLGSIMGFIEILQDDAALSPQSQRFLGNMNGAAEHMLEIINNILDMEQLSAGKRDHAPVEMDDLLAQLIARYEPEAEQNAQQLGGDWPTPLPPVAGDGRMLRQAFSNLVGNALKYTPAGGRVRLHIQPQSSADGAQPAMLRVVIEDNGYGIPREAQDKLFTQFYRVRTAQTKHIRGTGLGLSLVKAIIDEHEGRIWVESAEGQGSTFFVELPIWQVVD